MKRERAPKHVGVYFRLSETRPRYRGKPDRCFDICYKVDGKLVWDKVGWASEGYSSQMAANIRAERMRTIRHGEEFPKKKEREITFGEVWQKYDEWLGNGGKKYPANDRYYYGKHLKDRFQHKTLSEITPSELERLKNDLSDLGLAEQTVKHVLVLVRQMFNKAVKLWRVWQGENPVSPIKLPKPDNRRLRFLKPEEGQLLFEELAASNPQLHDIALLSLETGLRAGEIFDLKWKHIDFDKMLIDIRDPKNTEARVAYFTPAVIAMLEKRRSAENKLEEHIFKATNGSKIVGISHQFENVIRRLGLNDGIEDRRYRLTFHSLRHTFASLLAQNSETVQTIMEVMGHKTPIMALRYSHLIEDHKRKAVNRVSMMSNGFRSGSEQTEPEKGIERRSGNK